MIRLSVRKHPGEPVGAQWRVTGDGVPGDAAFRSWGRAMRFVNYLVRSGGRDLKVTP